MRHDSILERNIVFTTGETGEQIALRCNDREKDPKEKRMIGIRKILVPVDFSEPSKTAVNYGLSLALQFKARLVLSHIVSPSTGLVYTFPSESLAFEKDQTKYAKSMLPSLIPEEYRSPVDLEIIIKVGEVRDELLGIVTGESIDLVVMGTHGRNAVERFLLGSLTERMLRKLPVPVLTVSHLDPARELHTAGPVPLHHVLYATDLSDSADVGLKFSIELARGTGARLTVLHVLRSLESIYWGAEGGGFLAEELATFRDDTMRRLTNSIPKDGINGVPIVPMLVEGEAFREILRVASEDKADLIVLNLHGKNVVERALLGSTAERVIRLAHTPVLSIPVPAEYAARMVQTKGFMVQSQGRVE
jgi:nucleotide-binding universal stress UspA family protein